MLLHRDRQVTSYKVLMILVVLAPDKFYLVSLFKTVYFEYSWNVFVMLDNEETTMHSKHTHFSCTIMVLKYVTFQSYINYVFYLLQQRFFRLIIFVFPAREMQVWIDFSLQFLKPPKTN